MATKSSKRTSASSAQTPHSTSSSATPGAQRPQSPLSPTRLSRFQEKEELKHLNDRLASYIDRVRHLESENNRLQVQVQTNQETITKEVTSIKSLYESELSEARRILDDVAKEKAKLQIDCGKYEANYNEAVAKLNKKEKDLANAEKNAAYNESKVHDLQGRLSQALADRKKFEDENKDLKAELEDVSKQLASVRRHLEQETLTRVDLENRAQSLKEELTFKEQVHEKELTETRTRKQVEITEIDGQLQERYERQLTETLLELRAQYEAQMRLNREEIEALYDNKIEDLKTLNDQYTHNSSNLREELLKIKSRHDSLQSKMNELESFNASLLQRVKDLEAMLEDERKNYHALLNAKEDEASRLRDEIANQLKDYQDLMGIKVALDMEIAAYRSLLEGEEARLNITPGSERVSSRGTPLRSTPVGSRGTKRKRTYLSRSEESSSSNFTSNANASGDIEIVDQDIEGKFIKLRNKGENDINVGGWQLLRKSGDQITTYKFHRSVVVKAGTVVTVWSSDSEVTHNPPLDYVMKSQKWATGSNVTTRLLNASSEEVASRETFRQILSASSLRSSGGLEGHHSGEGDPQNQEKCVVM